MSCPSHCYHFGTEKKIILNLVLDNPSCDERSSGEHFVRVWVNNRADLVTVAKSVAEQQQAHGKVTREKKRFLKAVSNVYSTRVVDVLEIH
jgi:hypothetical protein